MCFLGCREGQKGSFLSQTPGPIIRTTRNQMSDLALHCYITRLYSGTCSHLLYHPDSSKRNPPLHLHQQMSLICMHISILITARISPSTQADNCEFFRPLNPPNPKLYFSIALFPGARIYFLLLSCTLNPVASIGTVDTSPWTPRHSQAPTHIFTPTLTINLKRPCH